jgi:hypothetical protein
VVFAHDTECALQAAVTLVNSTEPDTLTTVAELDRVWDDHGYTGRHDRTLAELDTVRELRPRLRELLTAERDDAAALVDWHIHAVPTDAPLDTRILVETAMAMIDVIRVEEMSRLGVCADHGCQGLVLDLSRNRSRRFCSTTCGNRNAVAAYRARKR